uniref:Secreted protein n=1 Tax=Haemonchus contortus TaxID=6289 RepID=A0A7I4YD70_HAECO
DPAMLGRALLLMLIGLFVEIEARGVDNLRPLYPGVCNLACRQGTKCVLVEPSNCYGCSPQAQCVQEECTTTCILPCPFSYSCVLVNSPSACCPVAACRPPTSTPPYTTSPSYTTRPPYTTVPPYTTFPPYTTRPPYTTIPPYTTRPPFTFWPFPFNFPLKK